MKPRDVSVSVIKVGDKLKVLCTFSLGGDLSNKNGKEYMVDENARRQKEKQIKSILEGMEFND